MAVDQEWVKQLEAAVALAQKEVTDCNEERARLSREDTTAGSSAGAGYDRDGTRPTLPDCTDLERGLAELKKRLERARAGRTDAPGYLSDQSIDLLDRIAERFNNADLLSKVIVVGTGIAAGESLGVGTVATGGHDIEDTVHALEAIPVSVRGRARTEIKELLRKWPEMPARERQFWEKVHAQMGSQ